MRAHCQLSDVRPAEADLWAVTATTLPVRIPPVILSKTVECTETLVVLLSSGSELCRQNTQPCTQNALLCPPQCEPLFCLLCIGAALQHSKRTTPFRFVEPHKFWKLFSTPPTVFHAQKAKRESQKIPTEKKRRRLRCRVLMQQT